MNAREQGFWTQAFLAAIASGANLSPTKAADLALAAWREKCPDLAADPNPAKASALVVALEAVAAAADGALVAADDGDPGDMAAATQRLRVLLHDLREMRRDMLVALTDPRAVP